MDYTGVEGLRYLAGRPLDIMEHHFEPGETVPPAVAAQIPYLESYLNSGYLYLLHPEKGYEQLPPHLYNAVVTKAEAKQIMEPSAGISTSVSEEAIAAHAESHQVARAEAEAIVRQDHTDPRLSAIAERVLFQKGVSRVDPDEAEKNAKAEEKAQRQAVKEQEKKADEEGTVDAVAPKASAATTKRAATAAKKG